MKKSNSSVSTALLMKASSVMQAKSIYLYQVKILILILVVSAAAYIAFAVVRFYGSVQVSKRAIQATTPYTKVSEDASNNLLILGDSTAVGVGANTSEESLAGRVANHMGATSVENYAVSGARTKDLHEQIERAKKDQYSLILIQTGGNDIIRFQQSKDAARDLSAALAKLPKSEKVIVLSAGNVGGAPLFPFFLRPLYTWLNKEYHKEFERVTEQAGYTYVNLYETPGNKKIEEEPEIYLAADKLHPSSAGYSLWFDAVKPAL